MAEVGSDPLDLQEEEEESSLILGGIRGEGEETVGLKTLTPHGDLGSQS